MTRAPWPEAVKPGRRIRATAKDNSVVAELTIERIDGDGEIIPRTTRDGLDGLSFALYSEDWEVEVLPDPLPTAGGVYIDNEGDYWLIQHDGGPLRYWSRTDGLQEPSHPSHPDPTQYTFTRLVPEGASA